MEKLKQYIESLRERASKIYSCNWPFENIDSMARRDTYEEIAYELEELLAECPELAKRYAIVLTNKPDDDFPAQLYTTPNRAKSAAFTKNICRPTVRPQDAIAYEVRTYEVHLADKRPV